MVSISTNKSIKKNVGSGPVSGSRVNLILYIARKIFHLKIYIFSVSTILATGAWGIGPPIFVFIF